MLFPHISNLLKLIFSGSLISSIDNHNNHNILTNTNIQAKYDMKILISSMNIFQYYFHINCNKTLKFLDNLQSFDINWFNPQFLFHILYQAIIYESKDLDLNHLFSLLNIFLFDLNDSTEQVVNDDNYLLESKIINNQFSSTFDFLIFLLF